MNFKGSMSPLELYVKWYVYVHIFLGESPKLLPYFQESRTQKMYFFFLKKPRLRWDYILSSLYSAPPLPSLPPAPKSSA